MRKTDVKSVLFPVTLQPLFLHNRNKPIQDFAAVVGKFDDKESIFSIVTKDYHLIKNEEALELGITAYQKLLDKTSKNDFEIFNVIYPKTRSSVSIDIVHNEFKVNVWKKEVYVPYLRIINSYNRTKALTFDIGFCRKLCDNGVIFEKDIVKIKIYHQRRNFNQNQLFDSFDITRFNKYIEEFKNHLLKTQEIKIDKQYFIATSAKALQMKFDISSTNKKIKSKALKDLGLFISQITPLQYVVQILLATEDAYQKTATYLERLGSGGKSCGFSLNCIFTQHGSLVFCLLHKQFHSLHISVISERNSVIEKIVILLIFFPSHFSIVGSFAVFS